MIKLFMCYCIQCQPLVCSWNKSDGCITPTSQRRATVAHIAGGILHQLIETCSLMCGSKRREMTVSKHWFSPSPVKACCIGCQHVKKHDTVSDCTSILISGWQTYSSSMVFLLHTDSNQPYVDNLFIMFPFCQWSCLACLYMLRGDGNIKFKNARCSLWCQSDFKSVCVCCLQIYYP